MDSETEADIFFFESDHLPLRGNQDYSNVLRTIAMLQSCKIRIHKQLQELDRVVKECSNDPESLLTKIQNREPILQHCNEIHIPEIPGLIGTYNELLQPNMPKIKEEPDADVKPATVRGRLFDESKPETFNKLWSCEEQRRLEELLIEYPPEQKEMRRYAKIAQALGNRTPQQVCSRVQKYFQKLHDAGMPIPGRKPKSRRTVTGKVKYFHRPSTFFPSYNVRVNMPDDDEFEAEDWRISTYSSDVKDIKHEDNDNSDNVTYNDSYSPVNIEAEQKQRDEKMLYILTELRNEKEFCGESYQPDPMAPLCDTCHIASTTLKRWHCRTCHIYLRECIDCIVSELLQGEFKHITHDIVAED